MTYAVTTFDICVQGFERLRSQSEFLLVAYVNGATTLADLREQLHSDIQGCDRFEGFDYDAARQVVDDYLDASGDWIARDLSGLEPASDNDCDESYIAFLYVECGE